MINTRKMKELTIELTNLCTHQCIHCSSKAIFNESAIHLPINKAIEAMEKFSDYEKIRFSGGEPFMYPNILSLLKEARKRGKKVEVLTSGVYWGKPIPERIIKIQQLKEIINNIAFSMWGNENNHFSITREFTFSSLDESINRVIQAEIPFSFNFVAFKNSIYGLENVMKYVGKRTSEVEYCTPKLGILRFIQQGYAEDANCYSLTSPQLTRLKEIAENFAEKYNVNLGFGCSFLESNCVAGTGKKVLTYDGKYSDCSALKYHNSSEKPACKEKW